MEIIVPKIEDFKRVNELVREVHELHVKWRPDLFVSVENVISEEEYKNLIENGNIVVIKTYSGHADVVASALDTLALDEVIGTIAGGDNCVFACLREGYTGDQFIASLKKRIPDVEE